MGGLTAESESPMNWKASLEGVYGRSLAPCLRVVSIFRAWANHEKILRTCLVQNDGFEIHAIILPHFGINTNNSVLFRRLLTQGIEGDNIAPY